MASKGLRLVIVTPEKTVVDQPVSSLRFPLFDGDFGVLPSRLPLVGRLGAGEMRGVSESGELRYFIDGGFAQIKGEVVTLLTDRAIPVAELELPKAEAELAAAQEAVKTASGNWAQVQQRVHRARKLVGMASRPK